MLVFDGQDFVKGKPVGGEGVEPVVCRIAEGDAHDDVVAVGHAEQGAQLCRELDQLVGRNGVYAAVLAASMSAMPKAPRS